MYYYTIHEEGLIFCPEEVGINKEKIQIFELAFFLDR